MFASVAACDVTEACNVYLLTIRPSMYSLVNTGNKGPLFTTLFTITAPLAAILPFLSKAHIKSVSCFQFTLFGGYCGFRVLRLACISMKPYHGKWPK